MPITQVEEEAMYEILADVAGKEWNWFTCHLLRLIARADYPNRSLLRKVYPEEVKAYERWYIKDFGDIDPAAPDKQVHILHQGIAVCGTLTGLPGDWPEGHIWVGLDEAEKATCKGCRKFIRYQDRYNLFQVNRKLGITKDVLDERTRNSIATDNLEKVTKKGDK